MSMLEQLSPVADLAALNPDPDVARLDENLQTVGSVEKSWGLPALGEEISFDLASQLADVDLNEFMWGLVSDVSAATRPVTSAIETVGSLITEPDLPLLPDRPAAFLPAEAPVNQARRLWSGVANIDPPKIISPDTVRDFQLRAVSRGLLPTETPIDGRWTPAMSNAYYETLQEEKRDQFAGKRPGALSWGYLADQLDKWLSPSGLLTVATELDFVPDFGEIGDEFSSWGDKWRAWHDEAEKSKGFWDFGNFFKRGKLFLDALTGPVDDIVVPVVNDLLLLTGVGEVVGVARGAYVGSRALQGVYEAGRAGMLIDRGLEAAQGVRLLNQGRLIGEIGHLQQRNAVSSFLARGVRAGGTALEDVGAMSLGGGLRQTASFMDGWRTWRWQVTAGKKALGTGMKLGQVGLLEQALFPNAQYTGSIGDYLEQRAETGIVGRSLADIALTPFVPTSIWKPGTFTQPAKRAAVAAARHNPWTRVLFDPTAKHVFEVARGIEAMPEERWTNPAVRAAFVRDNKKLGPTGALANLMGGGTLGEERAGQLVTWLTLMTSIDAHAVAKASEMVGTRSKDPGEWKRIFDLYRSDRIAGIKQLDPDDVDAALDIVARKGKVSAKGKGEEGTPAWWREALDGDFAVEAEESVKALIGEHNKLASAQYQDLLRSVQPGQIEAHVASFVNHIENWDEFTVAMDEVDNLFGPNGGLFDLEVPPRYVQGFARGEEGELHNEVSAELIQTLFSSEAQKTGLTGRSRWFQPLKDEPTVHRYNLTVERLESPTKQEALELLALTAFAQRRMDDLRFLERHPDRLEKLLSANGDIAGMNDAEVRDLLSSLFDVGIASTDETKRAAYAIRDLAAAGIDTGKVTRKGLNNSIHVADLSAAKTYYQQALDTINGHEAWLQRFNVSPALSLEEKTKTLRKLANHMAAEVEGLPAQTVERLRGLGYKVVKGQGPWVSGHDLIRNFHPLVEVNKRQRQALSLGAYFTEVDDHNVLRLMNAKLRDRLTHNLQEANALTPDRVLEFADSPEGALLEVDDITKRLFDYLADRRQTTNRALNQATGTGQKFLARLGAAAVPANVRDIKFSELQKIFPDFERPRLMAVYDAIKKSNDVGHRYSGLASIEDHLRGNNQLLGALNLFGRTVPATRMLKGSATGAVVGGTLGTTTALLSGEDIGSALQQGAGGAMIGAGLGSGSGRVMSAAAGAAVGAATSDSTLGAGLGALAGAAVGPRAARAGASMFANSKWAQYGYIADNLARLRNHFRFTLSPYFDLSRYTEGVVLGQVQKLPEGVQLPVNLSPSAFEKTGGDVTRAIANWKKAGRGEFLEEATALEDTERYFTQVGIMGFNPMKWQAVTYQRLLDQGVAGEEALKIVRRIYGYGMGRSAAEKSVNFIFFPFSFVKKYYSDMGSFLADDLTRLMVVHDGLKAYEVLDKEFDLGRELEEHLPALDVLRKLNNFAYGLSPGQLGGINRSVLNLFSPQGVLISDREGFSRFEQVMRSTMPALGDAERLLDSLEEQSYVLFQSPGHQTRLADVNAAYARFNEFKAELDDQAQSAGYAGYDSIARDPDLKPIADEVRAYRARLTQEFPAWGEAREKAAARRERTTIELQQRYFTDPTPLGGQVREWVDFENQLGAALREVGINMDDDPELVPPNVFDAMRDWAIRLSEEGHGFEDVYDRFFARQWGPIRHEVVAA